MFSEFGYVIFLILVLPYIESASRRRLSDFVLHYEPLSYDSSHVHAQHARARRSADAIEVGVQFHAHGRHFHLRLRRDAPSLKSDLQVEGDGGKIHNVDISHIYHGELEDDPASVVFGSLSDGVFEGKISSGDGGAYYVEHARRYFAPANRTRARPDEDFHSVIYKDADVVDPHAHRRHGHVGGCGITDEVVQWMERVQNSAVDEEEPQTMSPPAPAPGPPPAPSRRRSHPNTIGLDDYFRYEPDISTSGGYKYSRAANQGAGAGGGARGTRTKRATRSKDDNHNTCSLYIQTDPLLWRHVREGFRDRRDAYTTQEIDEKAREEILSLIAHHVTAVNYIYSDTKFDGRMEHRNIKFEVQRIKIDDSPCNTHFASDANPFCLENIDVSNFLNLHSLGKHEDFCLAYVFTYRDFTGGTLGLAWVASASGASGGICEKYKTYTETIGGLYQSTKRSLNTGIITFVNYNSRVPPKVSQLTLAHEIGHNFGSPHDFPAECRPGGPAGNYIMFASATSGDRPNNSRFSACSVGNISAVLDAVRDGRKRNCFSASAGAFCGNKIVEEGEECDCGYSEEECNDKCCYPRVLSDEDRRRNETAKGCHRRSNTQCSPSQGPCCHWDTCSFVGGNYRHTCRAASQCARPAYCNGATALCPASPPVPNKTECNNGTQLCIAGECTGSICLKWNMSECFLSSSPTAIGDGVTTVVDRRALCQLACQHGNNPRTCQSTAEFAHHVGLPMGGISLRPGSPCDNFQGYCDVFLKCRAVDAEGPLARLKNLLLNRATLDTVAAWVTEQWWAVLLGGVALVCCMGAFVKCCAVHTPSSNPKQPPARRLSETLRRPMNTIRRMRHAHQANAARSSRAPPTRGYQPGRAHRNHHRHKPGPAAPSPSRTRAEPYAGAYPIGAAPAYEMRAPMAAPSASGATHKV